MRLIIRRLWVRIPAPDTRWTFFTLICWKFCIVCLKTKKRPRMAHLKETFISNYLAGNFRQSCPSSWVPRFSSRCSIQSLRWRCQRCYCCYPCCWPFRCCPRLTAWWQTCRTRENSDSLKAVKLFLKLLNQTILNNLETFNCGNSVIHEQRNTVHQTPYENSTAI